jgi:hypothetical protein
MRLVVAIPTLARNLKTHHVNLTSLLLAHLGIEELRDIHTRELNSKLSRSETGTEIAPTCAMGPLNMQTFWWRWWGFVLQWSAKLHVIGLQQIMNRILVLRSMLSGNIFRHMFSNVLTVDCVLINYIVNWVEVKFHQTGAISVWPAGLSLNSLLWL